MAMQSPGPGRRLPSVLIIDDDQVSREVMATVLSMSGYTVHAAASGAQSLRMLDEHTSAPDVILMDTQMPGLSGAPLIRELRLRSRAKLYVTSGSEAPAEITRQADGFLLKPLGPHALQRLLEQHAPLEGLAESPVICSEVLAELRALMPEASVREIYTAVIGDLDRRLPLLEGALARRDAAEVRRQGHSIKGGCGMAGAAEAARIGTLLEEEGNDLDNTGSLLRDLQAATRKLQAMLEAEFPVPGK